MLNLNNNNNNNNNSNNNNNNNITIIWDMLIHTDRELSANKPDIVIKGPCQSIDKGVNLPHLI